MRRKDELRGYQNRVITHLYEHDVAQLVIGMGGGKTVCSLTAIRELIDDGVIRCGLVIAPKRVAQLVWTAEPKEWEHLKDTKIVHVTGKEADRLRLLNEPADVYTVGFDHVPWLMDHLKKLPENHKLFDLLCIDELSRLKGYSGKWGRRIMGIARRWGIRWGLTGTPRPNGYLDQYKPLAILSGGALWGTTNFTKWRMKHFYPTDFQQHNWQIRDEHEPKIIRKIASITVTIDDADMPDLPPITPIIHWIDLPPDVRQVYDAMERHMVAKYGDDPAVLAVNAGVATGKLSQIAQGFMYEGVDRNVVELHNEKLVMARDLVDALDGQPAIVVYDFIEDLDRLHGAWPMMPWFGDGTSDREAARYEQQWNRGELELLGMHPASAAHGLNMQFGGRQMIMYGMPWSAELYDQIIKRIHRPGQIGHCFVHHILARNTVDEIKYARVHDKIDDQTAWRRYLRKV